MGVIKAIKLGSWDNYWKVLASTPDRSTQISFSLVRLYHSLNNTPFSLIVILINYFA